jgi:hypothetical protein
MPPSTHSIVFGDIRAVGMSRHSRRCSETCHRCGRGITGQPESDLLVTLRKNPSESAIEAGLILPEPGYEQQWLEQAVQG